ncbi:MAG: 4Fe-4S dicluster domain-containing protein [candidate division WOR-3 bacterium]
MLASLLRVAFSRESWRDWLKRLGQYLVVYSPLSIAGHTHWQLIRNDDLERDGLNWDFRGIRAAEPVKAFFFSPTERVATFPEKLVPAGSERRLLLGLKACDLAALRVHDVMFGQGEFADPFYSARRRNTIMVVADCPAPAESCFCNLVGGQPFADKGADLSLSQVDDRVLVEVLSPEGEELLTANSGLWQPATESIVSRRDEERAAAIARLEQINPARFRADLPAALNSRATDRQFWGENGDGCVECSGCLMSCPTCYCFLLCDTSGQAAGTMVRTKVWDACYLAAYQRVGGGANPRAEFYKRFANRFHCKFEHFQNAHGFFACTGCGRCYKTCMGRIDIKKVLAVA